MTKDWLKTIGLGPRDRAVIVHADDVGMSQAGLSAFEELWDYGTVSSGAAMAPCPWFPAAAAYCREHPDVDMGIHATLTSEWDGFRWGPLSTRAVVSGLLDAEGCFPKTSRQVQSTGTAAAGNLELEAQADRLLASGIDPTHIDTHMGAVAHEKFMEGYIAQAIRLRIPAMLPKPDAVGFDGMVPDPVARAAFAGYLRSLESRGLPLLDAIAMMPLDEPGDQRETAKRILRSLPEGGISHFILHPANDTPELRAACKDWESRVGNFRCFMSKEIKEFLRDEGVILIGYRALRDAMRSGV